MSQEIDRLRAEWTARVASWQASREFENDDAGYRAWVQAHRNGFVLSYTGDESMLHTARCSHVAWQGWIDGEDHSFSYTTNKKVCADEERILLDQARARGEAPRLCQDCH
jgi:hypothetical protein